MRGKAKAVRKNHQVVVTLHACNLVSETISQFQSGCERIKNELTIGIYAPIDASERNNNDFPLIVCATQTHLNPHKIVPMHGGELRTAVNASLCLCGSGQPSNTCCLSLLLWLPPRGLVVDSLGQR